jgi:hypothetical protein
VMQRISAAADQERCAALFLGGGVAVDYLLWLEFCDSSQLLSDEKR